MESYSFTTSDNIIGFLQVGEKVSVTIGDKYSVTTKNFTLQEFESGKSVHWNAGLDDPIARAIKFFLVKKLRIGETKPYKIESLHKQKLKAGYYYPRINKQTPFIYEFTFSNHASAINELRAFTDICESMEEIFNVTDADHRNHNSFGNKIRHILTIACIEIENIFVNILRDNGLNKKNYKTTDYFRLLEIINLNEYELTLKMYPQGGSYIPFKHWSELQTTKTLSWYHAYNACKHDRALNQHLANLGEMINAVSALHILLIVQYGEEIFDNKIFHNHYSPFIIMHQPLVNPAESTPPIFLENGDMRLLEGVKLFDGEVFEKIKSKK